MKFLFSTYKKAFFVFAFFSLSNGIFGQTDTVLIYNNYKFKVGIKGLFEKSGTLDLAPETYSVNNFGAQIICKLGKSKSSLVSGIYSHNLKQEYFVRDTNYYYSGYTNDVKYQNIQIPLNYRLDTRIIYFSVGFYVNYLYAVNENNISSYKSLEFSQDRKWNYGYNLILGIEKQFTKNFSIFVEGGLNNDLSSLKKEWGGHFSIYGLGLGINYKIVKH